jgi:hypothetical protein
LLHVVVGEVLHAVGRVARAHEEFAVRVRGAAAVRRRFGERALVARPVGDVVLQQYLMIVVGARALLPGRVSAAAVQSLILPAALLVLPTLLASYYASYRDVFGIAEAG